MNVTLRQLNGFVAVAKTRSFTDAAARLHITQSTLSGIIRELEDVLGVRLVHRTTRSVQLSQIGVDFLPLAERILDDLERALRSISDLKTLNAGHLRIAVPQLMACTLMPQALVSFSAQHPKIDVDVVDCVVEDIASRVLCGGVDIGIGPERAPSDELLRRPLFDISFLAVFPVGHAFENRQQVSWAEFACHPLISLQGDYTEMLNNQLLASPSHIGLKPAQEVAFMTTALSMVSAGLGVTTCLPYAASLLDLHRLQTRPLVDPVITRRFHLYTRADRDPGPAAQRFADFLISYARDHGWGASS